MSVLKSHRVMITTLVGLGAASSMLLANAMAADPAQSKALTGRSVSAPQAHSSCVIREGTARTGVPTGSNPTRYRYSDSPYVGARYNSCTNKIVVYYGGYAPYPSSPTSHHFYHLRLTNGDQAEVPQGLARTWTFIAPAGPSTGISAQQCVKVTLIPAGCTRWSPVVQLALE